MRISATDGMSGITTVKQKSILPTVWARLFLWGDECAFFDFFGDLFSDRYLFGGVIYEKSWYRYGKCERYARC